MKKLGLFFLFFISIQASFGKTIYVLDKYNKPIKDVKISYTYAPYDSLITSFITDVMGKVILPKTDNESLYFIHPKYNPVYLNGLRLKEVDTVIMQKSIYFEPFTISARRSGNYKAATIETEKSIEKTNPGTAADLLNNSGEIFVQKSQLGGGSPMIRGFSANSVLLVVDGVRMNNAIYRSGNVQNILSIDPYYLRSANVIFGPGSLTYGSDALGGVMDFSTKGDKWGKDSSFKVKGSVLGKYGTAAKEKTGHVDFNIYNQKLSLTTSFTYASFDNLKMGKLPAVLKTRRKTF
jgi:hemoglobin/transferrin/lactoferrin receptor protein